jgi:phage gpG-like protein
MPGAGAGFAIHYEVTGATAVEHRLLGMGARAVDAAVVLGEIATMMRAKEAEVFDAEGPGWAPLAASTLEKKTIGTKILEETRALHDSLTQESDPNHIEEIGPEELIFGTRDPKAIFHKTGTSRMPSRDPLPLTPEDTALYTKQIQAFLIGLDRAEFGVGDFGIASNAGIFG